MIYIHETTTAEAILDEFAPGIDPEVRQKLIDAFDKRSNAQIENAATIEFNDRIKNAVVGEVKSYFIPTVIRQDIKMIADVLPAKDKARLMRLSYEDILSLKKDFESGIYGEFGF